MDKIKNDILTLGSVTKLVEHEDFENFINKLNNVDFKTITRRILHNLSFHFRYDDYTQQTINHPEQLIPLLYSHSKRFEIRCIIRQSLYKIMSNYFPKIDIKLLDIETIKNNFLEEQKNYKDYHADLVTKNIRPRFDDKYRYGFKVRVTENEFFYNAKDCDNLNKLEFKFHQDLGVHLTLVDTSKCYSMDIDTVSKNVNILSHPKLIAEEFVSMLEKINNSQPYFNFIC
ncbi:MULTISPECIES: hypothetical protein [unclassified Campylobacter]|uniref:hypothetical protein n=1 Tax=unclassified Campylobacter TaxID=2593542 RepID=UPI001DAA7337|nr:hypothetical protein [Campylobacter sp. RM12651]MBZ7978511.1 hypothetical protein [Campylobacter sp. RM12654]MBZ7980428.1 hypothetical protein [Campylobacter sp. RM12642]MBZ7990587.1 hypothetical protein [Campylobacter sp. RM9331]MBZ8004774.1 hypothetical protein [Campylobacter sp. RM9332]ULO04417.1 hypothetical protein AVBRAN_1988 [Campylobacter sp. RM12651]